MRNRIILAGAAAVLAAAAIGVITGPAVAGPVCDVPNPPPVCDPGDGAGSPTVTLATPIRQPSGLVVSGTAKDPDGSTGVQVQIKIQGVVVGTLTANRTTGAYSGTVPARAGSTVCALARNQNEGQDKSVCRTFAVQVDPFGSVDGVTPGPAGLRVRGWAIDPDTANPVDVHVYVDGAFATSVNASGSRPDVAGVYPAYGAAHGYDLTLPAGRGQHTVCVYGINVGTGTVNTQLGCGTVSQGGPPAAPSIQVNASPTLPKIWVYVAPASADATGFVIDRSASGSAGPWVQVHSNSLTGSASFTWEDGSVVQGTNYCYRVQAVNPYGAGVSPVVCRDLPLPALPRPTDVTVTGVTANSATLNWTDNAVDETQYRMDIVGRSNHYRPGMAGTGSRLSFTFTDLDPGKKLCFQVGPIKPGYGYDPATEVCVTTPTTPTPPPTPTSVRTANLWNCEDSGLAGSIWLFDHGSGAWTRAASAPSSWVDSLCGIPYSRPSASVNLPDGRTVTVVLVIVDGRFCRSEDPSQSACRVWEAGPVLGGRSGIVTDDVML
ncbi:fibronectin type III domain-containing protein [Micromonospora sp. NPDC049523]|uniref:fibronectin type III domain-containing protein n=1 Tax=Micromonospora sp. NPDC049523 TaxID=3155921 RepID=UPI0034470C7C